MKKFFSLKALVVFLTFVFAGCVQHTSTEDNDALVSYKEKAGADFDSLNKYLNIAIQEKEYGLINYLTNTAIDSLNAKIESLEQLKIPPSGEKFRQATISYTQSLVNVSKAYKAYSILSDTLTTTQQLDSIRIAIKNKEGAIDSTLKILIVAQKDFAREKNLKLEK
ncbi:hypothetical protein [Viscerimonas tarda]